MADGYTFRWTPEGKKFKEAIEKLSGKEVFVGFQRGKASHKPKEQGQDSVDMVDVASWNEFGTSNIPARPFLRTSIESHSEEIKQDLAQCCKDVLDGASPEQALAKVGVKHVGRVQETITEGHWVPNAPSTIRKKGSSQPLIDTGQMRQSVHFVVREKGE